MTAVDGTLDLLRGKWVIVRADMAGVVYGRLELVTSSEVTLARARQVWSWNDAMCVLDIAAGGLSGQGHKISLQVTRVVMRRDDCYQVAELSECARIALDAIPALVQ